MLLLAPRTWSRLLLAGAAAFALILAALYVSPGRAPPPPEVRVVGNRFELHDPAGQVLAQAALVGAVIAVDDGSGARSEIRVEAAHADPLDADIALYTLTQRDAQGRWQPLCRAGPDGIAAAFPVSGEWTPGGQHLRTPGRFGLACSGSAIGKCVRMGYKYWQTRADGAPLWALHQACTRMLRADYCGDGTPHTRDGTAVNVEDGWGIQRADPEPARFEASWDEAGAVCVESSRLDGTQGLAPIAARCPGHFLRREAGGCRSAPAAGGRHALLSNRS
jgi:ADYC domain